MNKLIISASLLAPLASPLAGAQTVPAPVVKAAGKAAAPAMPALQVKRFGRFNTPHFAMIQDARHAGLNIGMGDDQRLRVGVLTEGKYTVDIVPTVSPYARRAQANIEYEQRAGRALTIFSFGALRESGSPLNSAQSGTLAPLRSHRTTFAALSLAYPLTPGWSLVALASAARSSAVQDGSAFVAEGEQETAHATTFSVGLAGRGVWETSDRAALTLTVPRQVDPGFASLPGALSQRSDGALGFTSRILSMAPGEGERDLELSYSRSAGTQARVAGGLMLRMHPASQGGARSDMLIGLRYSRRF